jgi:hypothetical protein
MKMFFIKRNICGEIGTPGYIIIIAEIQAFPERACEKSAILDVQFKNVKFLLFMFEPYYICIIH